jgi:hypothetical protein
VRPDIAANQLASSRHEAAPIDAAGLRSRAGGYVVDMVIFSALTMVIVAFAGLLLMLMTDFAQQDASDPQLYTFLAVIGIGVPLIWSGMNLALLLLRGQTGGQYVAGVGVRSEDGRRVRLREALTWWLCGHPLLFSWPMALVTGLPLAAVLSLVLSRVTLAAFGVLILFCFLAPIIALVSAMLDRQHQALHDRIARVLVVPES